MLGSFVYARNEQEEYLLNGLGEYMFCAADGQHRCAVQVFYLLYFFLLYLFLNFVFSF